MGVCGVISLVVEWIYNYDLRKKENIYLITVIVTKKQIHGTDS